MSEKETWLAGTARCDYCGREWVAVAPVDADRLECPTCHTQNGQFIAKLVKVK